MNQNPPPEMTPGKALNTARILWASLLGAQAIFLIVTLATLGTLGDPPDPQVVSLLHYASIGMVIAAVPAGMFMRRMTYKKFWVDNVVSPQGYLQGNLVLWALAEGASLFGLVVTMLAGQLWPFVLPSAVAVAVQVVSWPDGAAMNPAEAPVQTLR